MPAHNTAQKERKSAGPQVKAGGKVMGKRDKRATACNWENIEEYLDLIGQRVIVHGLELATCIRALGAGRYEVKRMNGIVDNLPIAGSIRVKSGHKTHVEACMTVGDVVLINGGQITGTLTAGHMARAERHLRAIQERGCWAPPTAIQKAAGGSTVQIPSEFTGRIDTEARIVFPPTFFGAVVDDADAAVWEFDRSGEEVTSGTVRGRVGVKVESDDESVNMEDL
jgi:hypothetical protein